MAYLLGIRRLNLRETAIDEQPNSGNEAAVVRGQEDYGPGASDVRQPSIGLVDAGAAIAEHREEHCERG